MLTGVPELIAGVDAGEVKGIGVGGQMHGLVALDKDDEVIRPAILWNDGRTAKEVDYLNETVGREKLSKYTANIAFAGFTAPKLLWMKANESENFARIEKIMLPKDYLVYRLTGVHATDCSDASGMLLLDVEHKRWSEDILKTADFAAEQSPITEDRLGRNHVYFLPYLMGERSSINDTNARGAFVGMTMDTTRADITQAMLEGVAFAIRDSLEVARGLGVDIPRSNICGGGSKSRLWRIIVANILGIPLDMVTTEQGPGYGAAILAMVATGRFPTVQGACAGLKGANIDIAADIG